MHLLSVINIGFKVAQYILLFEIIILILLFENKKNIKIVFLEMYLLEWWVYFHSKPVRISCLSFKFVFSFIFLIKFTVLSAKVFSCRCLIKTYVCVAFFVYWFKIMDVIK